MEFDFEDGRYPVPAHRHVNPDRSEGGWVADTAFVAPTAHVAAGARVYGTARIFGTAHIDGNARVFGIKVTNAALVKAALVIANVFVTT